MEHPGLMLNTTQFMHRQCRGVFVAFARSFQQTKIHKLHGFAFRCLPARLVVGNHPAVIHRPTIIIIMPTTPHKTREGTRSEWSIMFIDIIKGRKRGSDGIQSWPLCCSMYSVHCTAAEQATRTEKNEWVWWRLNSM